MDHISWLLMSTENSLRETAAAMVCPSCGNDKHVMHTCRKCRKTLCCDCFNGHEEEKK